MTVSDEVRRPRLAGFAVLVLAAALVLLGLNASRMAASRSGTDGILAVFYGE